MAKRKPSYRRTNHNWMSMFLVTMVVVVILIVVGVKGSELRAKIDADKARIESMQQQIEKEELRAEEIERFRKFTQTEKFIEEIAKEQLGLVNPGELRLQRKE